MASTSPSARTAPAAAQGRPAGRLGVSAGMASMSILAIPAVAVLMAWLLLAEVPSSSEACGMLLIAAALVLISLPALRREWPRR